MFTPADQKKEIELLLIGDYQTELEIQEPKTPLTPCTAISGKAAAQSGKATAAAAPSKYNKTGIYFALVSVITTVIGATVWKWNPSLPTYELLTVRSAVGCIASYFLMKKFEPQTTIPQIFSTQNIVVGLCGALSLVTYALSLLSLTISEATTICATLGIFNGIFGLIFLKESYPNSERVLGVVCFFGVILIVKPPFIFGQDAAADVAASAGGLSRYVAGLLCLVSIALWSVMQICLRGVKEKCTGFAAIFQNNLIMGLLCAAYLVWKGEFLALGLNGYLMAAFLAITNLTLTWAIIKALEYEKPSVIGIVGYSEIIFAILADIVVFHTLPSLLTMIGMSVIIGSCLFLVKKAS